MEASGQLHVPDKEPPQHPLGRRQGGLQIPSGRCAKEKYLLPLSGIELLKPVTVTTELFWRLFYLYARIEEYHRISVGNAGLRDIKTKLRVQTR
jgi:hypothetical protein